MIRRFIQGVQRQISFLRLAKSFREMSSDKSKTLNLLRELDMLDIKSIGAQACYTTVDCTQDQMDLHEECKFDIFSRWCKYKTFLNISRTNNVCKTFITLRL